jgi:zinc/manganese transport system permease protein
MFEALNYMLWPLLACFVLVGIHAYLGIHVIARKVIFVDLALAQIAALGAVYGIFLGLTLEHHGLYIKFVSVLFTLVGALLFSFTRSKSEAIPHEAIIGIIYAVALSSTVLLTANLAHGADEVREMLAGNILWVRPDEVIYTAILYGFIGLIHIIFRRQFFALSREHLASYVSLGHARFWDFLFYASFGVVVTSSVGIGGVLLVFGFLVIPGLIGVMLATSIWARLLLAWFSGALVSILGVLLSFRLDLPSGPTIVVMLAILLLIIVIIKELISPVNRKRGVFHVAVLALVLFGLFIMPLVIKKRLDFHEHSKEWALLSTSDSQEIVNNLKEIKDSGLANYLPQVLMLLPHENPAVREEAIAVLRALKYKESAQALSQRLLEEKDDFLRMAIAQALLDFENPQGLLVLAEIYKKSESEFAREDAKAALYRWLSIDSDNALINIDKNYENYIFDSQTKKYKRKN